jgi:glucuronate isomerase
VEEMYAEDFTGSALQRIFNKISGGRLLDDAEQRIFKSAMLLQFAEWDAEKGWTQQFHIGALRKTNTRMTQTLGADTGWDSIGDWVLGKSLSRFLDKLDMNGKLAKTILYNLNPGHNELLATMIGNFNDGSLAGKMQWGSAWWFLDQKEGMSRQMNTLSNMGLLSRFVGMITDSRSFLSFPRHEYFRRILCNLFGDDMENGELPHDNEWTGKIIQDICYYNARDYFKFEL